MNLKTHLEEFYLLLLTFRRTIESLKIKDVVNNNIYTTDESRSFTNLNNQDAINKTFENNEN
jgi:hypothetical protein